MKLFKAVIFDMDGTIIDTEVLWKQTNIVFLKQQGILNIDALMEDISSSIHGSSTKKVAEIIKEAANLTMSVDNIICEKKKIASEIFDQEIKFIEGFIDFHNHLTKFNIPTAIATNADAIGLERVNKKLNLDRYFGHHMYNIEHVNFKGKPSPDIYLYAAENLKIKPEDCIAIEDSIHGIIAAKSASMYTIGINTAKIKEKLEKTAHKTIDYYHEISIKGLLI